MKRIQRKRTKGWRMPENTVYVGRPTRWGNLFKDEADQVYVWAGYRRKAKLMGKIIKLDPWVWYCFKTEKRNHSRKKQLRYLSRTVSE